MRTYTRYFDASDFNIEEINLASIKNITIHEHFVLKADDGKYHGKFILNKTSHYGKRKKKCLDKRLFCSEFPYRIGSKVNDIFYRCSSKIILFEFEKGSQTEVKGTYNDIGALLFDRFLNARDIVEYTDKLGNKMENNFFFREEYIEIVDQEGLSIYVKVIKVFDNNDELFDTRIHASVLSADAKLVDNFRPFEWMVEELEELPTIYSQY